MQTEDLIKQLLKAKSENLSRSVLPRLTSSNDV